MEGGVDEEEAQSLAHQQFDADPLSAKGKTIKYTCKHCSRIVSAASVSKLRHHLLGTSNDVISCSSQSAEFREVKAVLEAQQRTKAAAVAARQRLASAATAAAAAVAGGGARPSAVVLHQSTMRGAVARMDVRAVHDKVAAFLYGTGTPFNCVRSTVFLDMIAAVAAAGPSYKPPTYDAVRGPLLAVTRLRAECQPLRDAAAATGGTLACDGWSDANSRSLLTMLLVTSKGSMLLDAVDTTGCEKSAAYIAAQLSKAIEGVGSHSIVAVVTDNAPACKAAGALIMEQYPSITWLPCVAHVMDLILEDIGKLDWAADTLKSARKMVMFVKNQKGGVSMTT